MSKILHGVLFWGPHGAIPFKSDSLSLFSHHGAIPFKSELSLYISLHAYHYSTQIVVPYQDVCFFSVRDKSHRIIQTKRKLLEITVKNYEEIDNSWDGSKLCELLEPVMKAGGDDPGAMSD